MLNMKFFDVKQLNAILRYAIEYTDFKTESLANYDNRGNLPDVSQETIHSLFADIAEFRLDSKTEEQFKEKIDAVYNSYDWCRIVKFMISNTAIIVKNEQAPENHKLSINWAYFISCVKEVSLCKEDPFISHSSGSTFDQFFTGERKETTITSLSISSAEFKDFMGQLIVDGYPQQAKAIHLMLQYCARIVALEEINGMSAAFVAKMFGIPFFMALECDSAFMQGENIKKSNSLCLRAFQKENSTAFASYLAVVLKDELFTRNFYLSHYSTYSQNYSDDFLAHYKQFLSNPIEKRMQEISHEELKKSSSGNSKRLLPKMKLPSPRHNAEIKRKTSLETKTSDAKLYSASSSHSDSVHESPHLIEKAEPSPRKPRGNSKGAVLSNSSGIDHNPTEVENVKSDRRGSSSPHRRGNISSSTASLTLPVDQQLPKKGHKIISNANHRIHDENKKPNITNSFDNTEQIEAVLHHELRRLNINVQHEPSIDLAQHTQEIKSYLPSQGPQIPSLVVSGIPESATLNTQAKKPKSTFSKTT